MKLKQYELIKNFNLFLNLKVQKNKLYKKKLFFFSFKNKLFYRWNFLKNQNYKKKILYNLNSKKLKKKFLFNNINKQKIKNIFLNYFILKKYSLQQFILKKFLYFGYINSPKKYLLVFYRINKRFFNYYKRLIILNLYIKLNYLKKKKDFKKFVKRVFKIFSVKKINSGPFFKPYWFKKIIKLKTYNKRDFFKFWKLNKFLLNFRFKNWKIYNLRWNFYNDIINIRSNYKNLYKNYFIWLKEYKMRLNKDFKDIENKMDWNLEEIYGFLRYPTYEEVCDKILTDHFFLNAKYNKKFKPKLLNNPQINDYKHFKPSSNYAINLFEQNFNKNNFYYFFTFIKLLKNKTWFSLKLLKLIFFFFKYFSYKMKESNFFNLIINLVPLFIKNFYKILFLDSNKGKELLNAIDSRNYLSLNMIDEIYIKKKEDSLKKLKEQRLNLQIRQYQELLNEKQQIFDKLFLDLSYKITKANYKKVLSLNPKRINYEKDIIIKDNLYKNRLFFNYIYLRTNLNFIYMKELLGNSFNKRINLFISFFLNISKLPTSDNFYLLKRFFNFFEKDNFFGEEDYEYDYEYDYDYNITFQPINLIDLEFLILRKNLFLHYYIHKKKFLSLLDNNYGEILELQKIFFYFYRKNLFFSKFKEFYLINLDKFCFFLIIFNLIINFVQEFFKLKNYFNYLKLFNLAKIKFLWRINYWILQELQKIWINKFLLIKIKKIYFFFKSFFFIRLYSIKKKEFSEVLNFEEKNIFKSLMKINKQRNLRILDYNIFLKQEDDMFIEKNFLEKEKEVNLYNFFKKKKFNVNVINFFNINKKYKNNIIKKKNFFEKDNFFGEEDYEYVYEYDYKYDYDYIY